MEKIWILYALWGLLCAGLMDFNKKIVLMRGYTGEVYLLTTSVLFFIFFWCYALLFWDNYFNLELIAQGIIYGITTFLTPLWMLTAYKYSSVSFSLVTIRLIASFLLLLVGVFIIWDHVSILNILWFIFWMVAIFLLSWWKKWSTKDIHIKGILWMLIAIFAIVFGHSFLKYIVVDVNMPDFVAVQTTSSLAAMVGYLYIRKKFDHISLKKMLRVSKYSMVPLVLFPMFLLYFLPNLYIYGPLSLGYKILSYSIVIPILLSIIFYREPIDKTRIIALGLTLVSILLFI